MLRRQRVFGEEAYRDHAPQLLADMLGPVTIGRDSEARKVYAETKKPAERLRVAACGGSLEVVAGAGFEPTTFRL